MCLKGVILLIFKLKRNIRPKKGRIVERYIINEDEFIIDLRGISSGQDILERLNKIQKCLPSDKNYFIICRIEREDIIKP
jgi:hypothetical protein